jgi:hypothetical protein
MLIMAIDEIIAIKKVDLPCPYAERIGKSLYLCRSMKKHFSGKTGEICPIETKHDSYISKDFIIGWCEDCFPMCANYLIVSQHNLVGRKKKRSFMN